MNKLPESFYTALIDAKYKDLEGLSFTGTVGYKMKILKVIKVPENDPMWSKEGDWVTASTTVIFSIDDEYFFKYHTDDDSWGWFKDDSIWCDIESLNYKEQRELGLHEIL